MQTINGVGTTLYGKREVNTDGSFIATKWFVFFLLPIIPLGSYRVWQGKTEMTILLFPGQETQYKMVPVPLNFRQIIYTSLAIYGVLILSTVGAYYIIGLFFT